MELMDGELELRVIQKLEGHTDRVWGLAWNPAATGVTGMLASCSGDKTVRIWQKGPSGSWDCSAVLEDTHARTVRSCAWSPSGKLLATASFDGTTAVWEHVGGEFECVATLEVNTNDEICMFFSLPTLPFFRVTKTKLRVSRGTPLDPCLQHVLEIRLFGSGKLNRVMNLSVFRYCKVTHRMLRWSSGIPSWMFWFLSAMTTLLRYGIYQRREGEEEEKKRENLEKEKEGVGLSIRCPSHLCTLSGYHDRTIFSVHWSREGLIVSGAADDAIRLFTESKDSLVDQPSYKMLVKKEKAHDMDVNSVQWNLKEPRLLASASDDGTIKIWELSEVSK
ncbi:hypothetical protein GW17_00029774 [Ensete ventricosum]|nr:hypothetical protein GW17_00029774 [Ensete ventricosum]